VRDLSSEVQQNSSRLASLDSTVSQSLNDIKETVTRTEGVVCSIASTTLVTSQAVTELSTKLDALSEQFLGQLSEMVSCGSQTLRLSFPRVLC
jgi:methyl-accepting chemotaxis protein